MLKKIILALLSLVFLLMIAYQSMVQFRQLTVALPGPYFDLKAGTSLARLCKQWQQEQLLTAWDCQRLKLASLIQPELRQLKAGVYRVQPDLLSKQLALFRSGKVAQFSFMLREGQTLQQSLSAIQNAEFLVNDVEDFKQLAALLEWPLEWGDKPVHLEALFLPETYFYTAHTKATELYRRAHRALLRQLDAAWQLRTPELPLKNRYELLILASIIEKETAVLSEKPLIAAVFSNRIRKNMKLQTDPTVIYGLGDRYQGDITRAHLRDPHPYNTYVHFGLPPGPIALVSVGSLQAAAQPMASDMLFFVAKGDGSHHFSVTYQEHKKAIDQYIFGKSP